MDINTNNINNVNNINSNINKNVIKKQINLKRTYLTRKSKELKKLNKLKEEKELKKLKKENQEKLYEMSDVFNKLCEGIFVDNVKEENKLCDYLRNILLITNTGRKMSCIDCELIKKFNHKEIESIVRHYYEKIEKNIFDLKYYFIIFLHCITYLNSGLLKNPNLIAEYLNKKYNEEIVNFLKESNIFDCNCEFKIESEYYNMNRRFESIYLIINNTSDDNFINAKLENQTKYTISIYEIFFKFLTIIEDKIGSYYSILILKRINNPSSLKIIFNYAYEKKKNKKRKYYKTSSFNKTNRKLFGV